jgi:predicted dehydrogenase
MRIAIIGAGLIGQKRAAAKDPGDSILGFFDISTDAADYAASVFGGISFTSLDQVLDCVEPGDAVVIATPHNSLAGNAQIFVKAGCHVLLEKPGARSYEELDGVHRVMREDQIVAVGYNHRFHPGLLRLREISASEPYGPLLSIRARYGHGGRPGYETEWRADKTLSGGGELLDQGSHLIDLTRYVGGRFDLLTSHIDTLKWDMKVEDNAWLIGSTGSRGVASLHASWTEWKNIFSFEAFFETAKVEVNGLGGSYGPESVVESFMEKGYGPPLVTSTQFPPGDRSWNLEWQDFKQSVKSGDRGQGARIDDALAVLEVVGEVYGHANI